MAKASAAPAAPPPAAPRTLELSAERDKLQQYFDDGCIRAAEDGEDSLSWDCLQSGRQIGLDDRDIESHRLRMVRVVALRVAAGTRGDLDADTQAAAAAKAKLAADLPALREQIEALEKKVKALEESARAAEDRRFRRVQAREGLREVAKRVPWLRDRYDRSRGRALREFAALPAIEARIALADAVATLIDPDGRRTHLEGASRDTGHPETAALARAALTAPVHPLAPVTVDEAGWRAYVAALRSEAERLRPELEALRAAKAEAMREPELILDHYLPS